LAYLISKELWLTILVDSLIASTEDPNENELEGGVVISLSAG
jgi:hypothetical protein